MANIIEMPKLSDTMTTGTLVKWLKKEGDKVATGDMLAEVETDKATMELECFFDGTLIKIFAAAGASVPLGAPLCAVGQPGEKVETPAGAGSGGGAQPASGSSSDKQPGKGEETPQQGRPEAGSGSQGNQSGGKGSSSSQGGGDGDAQGRGSHGGGGAGQGGKEAAGAGGGRASGTAGAGEQAAGGAAEKRSSSNAGGGVGTATSGGAGGAGDSGGQEETIGGRIRISPLAKKLAAEKRIDPGLIKGSGPNGRIVRADVIAAELAGLAGKSAAPAGASRGGGNGVPSPFKGAAPGKTGPLQDEKLVPLSNMRATIARRLVESKTQIPHFYLEIEVDAAPLLALRTQLNSALESEGVKLSVNDFILKASAEALRRVPAVNCSWADPGTGQAAIRQHAAAHVSFAVAIDDGLITPVIKDTHTKNLFAISTEAKSLAKQAKDKKLQPAQFTGGTFCVSNLGMMGIDRFNAIINPPNAAILAVGTTVKKPVVVGEKIEVGQRMSLTLSVDHRVVDGAVGATFLSALKDLLEKPALLLL